MPDPSPERGARSSESMRLPPSAPYANEGQTVAAWTLVIVVILGAAVAAAGVLLALVWLFWAGLALVVLGVLIGKVLQMAGYGQGGANTVARQRRAHEVRTGP
jgi:hypothetical protein